MQMSFTGERYVPEVRGQIYYEHFHRYALVLEMARDRDVLDIASGEGYGSAALALVARSVLGVDKDEDSVRHAAARYTAMNLDFRAGDCTHIPVADASIDLVVSFETIEHLEAQERMLAEVKRVLRPNGRLVVSSSNKLVYSDERSYKNPNHVRELYFHEFRDLLRGFFPALKLFGQRVFAASAVHPLRGASQKTRWLAPSTVGDEGIAALPSPEYFIAVCGQSAEDLLPDLCSVYLDPRNDLLADIQARGLPAETAAYTRLADPKQAALPVAEDAAASDRAQALDVRTAQLLAERDDLEQALLEQQAATTREADRAADLGVDRSRLQAAFDEERSVAESRVAQLQTELDVKQRSFDEVAARLQQLEAEIVAAEASRSQSEGHTAELLVDREILHTALREQQASAEGHARAAEELRAEREALQAIVRDQRSSVDQHVRDAAALRLEHGALLDAFTKQQKLADDRANTITELAAEREALASALAFERQCRDEESHQVADLRADRTAHRIELKARVAERDDANARASRCEETLRTEQRARRVAERRVAQLQLEMRLHQESFDELSARAQQADGLLREIVGSTSWRMTLPARRVMKLLRPGR
jgi:protein-L-isoaspartate O-methyltransferase